MDEKKIDAALAQATELTARNALIDKMATLIYQAAADFAKVSLYCLFLVNGGALTVFANKGLADVKQSLVCFAVGIVFAIITNVTAFECALRAGNVQNRFRREGKDAERRLVLFLTLTVIFALTSLSCFIVGCFLALP